MLKPSSQEIAAFYNFLRAVQTIKFGISSSNPINVGGMYFAGFWEQIAPNGMLFFHMSRFAQNSFHNPIWTLNFAMGVANLGESTVSLVVKYGRTSGNLNFLDVVGDQEQFEKDWSLLKLYSDTWNH